MKLISRLFAVVLTLTALNISAQTFEGKLTMKTEIIAMPAEYKGMEDMFKSSMIVLVKGDKSRAEVTSAMSTTIVINDVAKKQSIVCMNMMGNKIAMVSPYDEESQKDAKMKMTAENIKITSETKTIAGFKCKKAIWTMKTEDNKEMTMEIWFTEEIANSNKEYSELPGMPMEYTIKQSGMEIHYVVTEVSKQSVPDSSFTIPEGYQVKTKEEMKKMFPAIGE